MVEVERLVGEENGRRRSSDDLLLPEPPDFDNPEVVLLYTAEILTLLSPALTDLRSNVRFLESYAMSHARLFEESWSLVPAVRVMES